jgi:hypothetical protein
MSPLGHRQREYDDVHPQAPRNNQASPITKVFFTKSPLRNRQRKYDEAGDDVHPQASRNNHASPDPQCCGFGRH